MIIEAPQCSRMPALRGLWREAFGDTEEFLDAFESTAFHRERCRCVVSDKDVAAALYWFECMYREKPVAYLYAVATAKAYRGRGICHALMEDTHRHLAEAGYEGAVVVPGSPELFGLYEGMGYGVCSTVREFSCAASPEKSMLQGMIRRIDKAEYARLRREMLPEGGVIQEGENLEFLQTQARFYTAPGFLMAARREGRRLCGTELLGDGMMASEIVSALGCARGTFRVPGEGRPFAMYRPLKENTFPAPTYFGLAFDE